MSGPAAAPASWVASGVWVRRLGAFVLLLGMAGPLAFLSMRAKRPVITTKPEPKQLRPEMMILPPGTFQMGSTDAPYDTEKPRHTVQLTHKFALSISEVTQEQYEAVMGDNPSNFRDPERPVEKVSWSDAIQYCNKLTEMEGGMTPCYVPKEKDDAEWKKDCTGYRLPTEAEWEYAARAGQSTEYAGSNNLDEVGWYDKNANRQTQPVMTKTRNARQLYDMSGNVYEWVWDWYEESFTGPAKDPTGPQKGSDRVDRGGSWVTFAVGARVSYRSFAPPSLRLDYVGFRVARSFP